MAAVTRPVSHPSRPLYIRSRPTCSKLCVRNCSNCQLFEFMVILLKLDFAPTVMLFRSLRWSSAPRTVHASAATSAADIDGSRMLGSCASVCEIETRERREDKEKRGEGSANWSCLDAAARLTRQCKRGGKTGREAVVVGSGRRTAVWPKTGYRQLAQLSSCPGRLQRQSCQRGGPGPAGRLWSRGAKT